jgi:carbon-monoxide dehydrogenase large subunit
VQGDTENVANGEGTGGSRSAALGGSAVYLATEKIVGKAKAIAAHLLGAEAGEVDRRALPARHPPGRNARHPRAAVARHPRSRLIDPALATYRTVAITGRSASQMLPR